MAEHPADNRATKIRLLLGGRLCLEPQQGSRPPAMELRRQGRLRSDAISDRLAGRTAVSDTAKTGSKPVPRTVDEGEESSPDAVNVCQASSSLVVHPQSSMVQW